MAQYLVAIHHPDGYDGSLESEAMHRDIDVLNEEMVAKGSIKREVKRKNLPCGWNFLASQPT